MKQLAAKDWNNIYEEIVETKKESAVWAYNLQVARNTTPNEC